MLNELSAAYKAYADAGGKVDAQTSDWIRAAVEAVPVQQSAGADLVERIGRILLHKLPEFTCHKGETLQDVALAILAVARPVIEAEARKGLHSDADIEKVLRAHWDGPGDYDSADTFVQEILGRLSPHKEERVRVERLDSANLTDILVDGIVAMRVYKGPYGEDVYSKAINDCVTGLRAEIREGKL